MSKMMFCSSVLLMRMRRPLKMSRIRNAPSSASITGISFSAWRLVMTSSITVWMSWGYANEKPSDISALPIVLAASNLYGFKYTATRRMMSHVDRDLAPKVGSPSTSPC